MISHEVQVGQGRKRDEEGPADEENREQETGNFYGFVSKPNIE